MTLDEAKKIALIARTADGGCPGCVMSLAQALEAAFPQFVWEFVEDWDEERVCPAEVVEDLGGYRPYVWIEVSPRSTAPGTTPEAP